MYSERIKELMSKMTFEEKVGQMTQCGTSIYSPELELNKEVTELIRSGRVGSFLSVSGVDILNEMQHIAVEESRLGIPLFFAHDVIHGYRTIFPCPAGEACSFEPELAEKNFKMMAAETRANGLHVTWTPMVDITRDQRWGRGFEGAGEDVHLGCEFARARVRGIQHGDLKDNDVVAACAKHYVGYGEVLGGRDYNSVDMSDNNLYNVHIPTFRAAVTEGVEFIMTAFHDLNGVPCTSNKKLLKDILRDEMGFGGLVISDAASLEHTVVHGYAKDDTEAAEKALRAGLDIEMSSTVYLNGLKQTPENEKLVDEAVYKILDLKFRLGLFENPYTDTTDLDKKMATPEYTELARNIARRSMVLLENNGVLPFKKKKVAVIGRLADDKQIAIGGWTPAEHDKVLGSAVTIVEGLKNCADIDSVIYAPAYDYIDTTDTQTENVKNGIYEYFSTNDGLINEAVAAAEKSDVVVFVLGEVNVMNGEAKSRTSLAIPKVQTDILDKIKSLGKPVVAIVVAGRPLLVGDIRDKADALFFTYSLGSEMGNAVADILTGAYNPSAKLCYTIPSADGQCPTMFYAHHNTGKPYDEALWWTSKYIDAPTAPAYCFGYGKSYTEFAYDNISTDKDTYKFGDKIKLTVDVENIGNYDGEEVVEIYMRDLVGSIVRPVKQLIAFKKIMIEKGSKVTVEFLIDTDEMGYYMDREYVKEAGEFVLFAGGSSDTALSKHIEIEGD